MDDTRSVRDRSLEMIGSANTVTVTCNHSYNENTIH